MTNIEEVRQRLEMLADDELVSILLERNEEEWQPEIFDIAASILNARGVSLEEAGELEESAEDIEEEIVDDMEFANLATVARYDNTLEARTDLMALEAGGLKAWIFDSYVHQATGYYNGVRLQVLAEDLHAAMRILQSDRASSCLLPPEIAEPPCPKCGSREVTEIAEVAEVLDPLSPVMSSAERQVWLYHCISCGHKWPASDK